MLVMTTPTSALSAPPSSLKRDQATIDLLTDFVAETDVSLARMDEMLMSATRAPMSQAQLQELFRLFHAVKAVARFIDAADVSRVSVAAEAVLDLARTGRLTVQGDVLERLFDASTVLRDLIGEVWTATLEERTFTADGGVDRTIAALDEVVEPLSKRSTTPSLRFHPEGA